MAMAIDALSPAASHSCRNSSKRAPATFAWTRKAVPHNKVRGAMRMAAWSGSSAGNASAILVARGQLGGIDQRGQPPPPRIGVDLGQLPLGIGDAQQLIEQQQILWISVGDPGAERADTAQQARD